MSETLRGLLKDGEFIEAMSFWNIGLSEGSDRTVRKKSWCTICMDKKVHD